MLTLGVIGTWLASPIVGFFAKFVIDLIGQWQAQRQADANAKAAGASGVTAAINKESADAERRASEVAVNRPDVGTVVAGMERGDTF